MSAAQERDWSLLEATQDSLREHCAILDEIKDQMIEMVSLLDGAYDIVDRYNAETPSQKQWKEDWLQRARKCGAEPRL